jgi:uncharacterized membrane protein
MHQEHTTRSPAVPLSGTPGAPRAATRGAVDRHAGGTLPHGLGWLSLGLGAAAFGTPRLVSHMIGIDERSTLLRLVGLREIASGVGILAGRHTGGVLSRVLGDMMDLSLLGTALRANTGSRRARVAAATAVVAGVTALDLLATRRVNEATGGSEAPVDGAITINRPAEELYRFWRDLPNLARFMKRIAKVEVTGDRTSHWTAKTVGRVTLSWDAEITADEPNRRIAWRSKDGASVDTAGEVTFSPATGGRGTVVRVSMHYRPPGGVVGSMVAKILGKAADLQLRADLRRFAQLMEAGEIPTNAMRRSS